MILEFSQNGHIRREFELRDTPQARALVARLNQRSLGRGGFYWRTFRHSCHASRCPIQPCSIAYFQRRILC